jgi:hypothetical protein
LSACSLVGAPDWVEYGGRLTVEVDFTQSDVSNFVRDEIDVAGSVSVG